MNKDKIDIGNFGRYTLLGQAISISLIITGIILLIQKPTPTVISQLLGWFFLIMGPLFVTALGRRKRRLIWVYKNIIPVPMNMKLEIHGFDPIDYFAYIAEPDKKNIFLWKTSLYPPTFDTRIYINENCPVQVYIDPADSKPAIIRTAEGLLWVMAGSGSTQKL
jgi:hypothetical protein